MSAFWLTVAVCLCILYMFMHFEKLWLFKKALLRGIFVYLINWEGFRHNRNGKIFLTLHFLGKNAI